MAVERNIITATIANGASLSDVVHLKSHALAGIQMPSAWTAADLTLQASYDGTTYVNVYDKDDAEVTIQAAADRFIALDAGPFIGIQRLKIRSGTAAAAVNQGGARLLQVVTIG